MSWCRPAELSRDLLRDRDGQVVPPSPKALRSHLSPRFNRDKPYLEPVMEGEADALEHLERVAFIVGITLMFPGPELGSNDPLGARVAVRRSVEGAPGDRAPGSGARALGRGRQRGRAGPMRGRSASSKEPTNSAFSVSACADRWDSMCHPLGLGFSGSGSGSKGLPHSSVRGRRALAS